MIIIGHYARYCYLLALEKSMALLTLTYISVSSLW